MSKQRRTLSLTAPVDEYLGQEGRNASQYVERLVKLDMGEEAFNEEMIRMRMDMEKEAYQDKASSAARHLRRYNRFKDRLAEVQDKNEAERDAEIERAVDVLRPASMLSSMPVADQIPPAGSDDVQELASDIGMDAEDLRDEVVRRVKNE